MELTAPLGCWPGSSLYTAFLFYDGILWSLSSFINKVHENPSEDGYFRPPSHITCFDEIFCLHQSPGACQKWLFKGCITSVASGCLCVWNLEGGAP